MMKMLLILASGLFFGSLFWFVLALPLGDIPESIWNEIIESENANIETGIE
jgi:hypothetical protein